MHVPRASALDETRLMAVNGYLARVSGRIHRVKLFLRSDRNRRWQARVLGATFFAAPSG